MKKVCLIDFYQGWLIEIAANEEGFSSVCYSPCREKFSDTHCYASANLSLSAARGHIDRYSACYSLTSFLRGLYESDKISFEDWRSLQQSLTQVIKAA